MKIRRCRRCSKSKPWDAFRNKNARRCLECDAEMCPPCKICGKQVPLSAGSKPRTVCEDPVCHAKDKSERAKRTWTRHRQRTEKRCPVCDKVKPLTAEHWNRAGARGWDFYCKPCKSADKAARYETSPVTKAKARARAHAQRLRILARREADPDFDREYRAMRAAQRRDWERRRREETKEAERTGIPRLPVRPLLNMVESIIRKEQGDGMNDATETIVCERLGIDPRRLYDWRNGAEWVRFDTADRVITNADRLLTDVYAEDELPEVLRA